MYSILVCDDEKDIVSALKIYLMADGYSTYMKKWKDDKLFGFGVDTMVDYENGDSVVQTGVKMSMFTVLRRKMTRLGELFIFKNRKKNEPQHEKEKK